jgi:putative ABC transport system substrate-binding protein
MTALRAIAGFLAMAIASACLAQAPAKVHRVGILATGIAQHLIDAFLKGMNDLGYVEGKNLVIERRWTKGRDERYPALARELVEARVDVIFATNPSSVRAARGASTTTPIVFANISDPVGDKFVASLQRPGGNLTGLTIISSDLAAKRFELLTQALPKAARVGLLFHSSVTPIPPSVAIYLAETKRAAERFGKVLAIEEVQREEDLGRAFDNLRKQGIDALIVAENPVLLRNRNRITELATKAQWPTMFGERNYVEAGGLISYGASYSDQFRRAASYVDKILKGAKPGDLPVEQPTVFELAVNLKAAKAMGITLPRLVVGRADIVIE